MALPGLSIVRAMGGCAVSPSIECSFIDLRGSIAETNS
jgi:hypothetical protein